MPSRGLIRQNRYVWFLYRNYINTDGADASRRTIGLRIIIRFRSCASRLTIKRMQQTIPLANKFAPGLAPDPQPVQGTLRDKAAPRPLNMRRLP